MHRNSFPSHDEITAKAQERLRVKQAKDAAGNQGSEGEGEDDESENEVGDPRTVI
jgi:hypothetical protein